MRVRNRLQRWVGLVAMEPDEEPATPDNSDDDETANWRAELRRQVDEELERQVRLKLGLYQTSQEEDQTEGDVGTALSRYSQLSKIVRTRHNRTATECEFPHVAGSGGCVPVEHDSEVAREEWGKEEKKNAVLQKKGKEMSCKVSDLGQKAQLFLHLNKYHGPPLSQLRQLASSKYYQTRAGEGKGGPPPGIQWPLEACIALPTPQHLASSPAPQPFLSTSTSELPLHHPMVQSTSYAITTRESMKGSGRAVYTCGESTVDGGKVENGQLTFDSRFESGNLYQARQTGPHEYTLVLKPDLYSKRHVQWFYFRVSNMDTKPIYTFHIVNFEKSKSLYSKGLQPLVYSEHEATTTGVGWRRIGWNVIYSQSRVHYPPHMCPDRSYFTLSWRMQFDHHSDTCYLAHCYPYPLSALYKLLGNVEDDEKRAKYIKREELCRTLAGNSCPLLTITEFADGSGTEGEGKKKKGVVVTARVHPGETNSSWMMEGLILFLTSDSPHAHALRRSFVFKLVPMLNPDGVVVGNYRTSLAGVDLNRVFKTPVTTVFPTISHTKKMMNGFQQEREVCVYVDLHGHSRKHNVFMYGCHTPKGDHTHFLYEKLLPFLLSEQAPDMFSLASCKFTVQRCKEATGRVVTWRSGVPHSFTLEATFCGSNLGPRQWQFSECDLLRMGQNLGEAFYKFSKCLQNKTYQLKVMAQLAEKLMERLATPTDHTHCPASTLPDVVTSTTTALPRSFSPHTHTSVHQQKKEARQSLRKFKRLDMSQLELESSTSGSDSDNQDFKFRRKKKGKDCDRRRKMPTAVETQSDHKQSLLPSLSHLSRSQVLPQTHLPELTLPSLLTQTTCGVEQTGVLTPAKNQSSKWKFVNRYSNRSNGGIPMFAEERLKERMEKMLKAKSEIVHLPPAPFHPNLVAQESWTRDHTHHNHTVRPQPLWTNDSNSIPKLAHHLSPRQHYHQIKELVEFGHSYPHTPSPIQLLHPSLSPQLLSYISHLWNK